MSASSHNQNEGTSTTNTEAVAQTLDDVMRTAPSDSPNVIVIDETYSDKKRKEEPSLQEDLWLTSADGRYTSTIIPLRVGRAPDQEVFQVHRDILETTEYFRKALCGDFREADAQAIDLPEEDPAIFHFLVAFLYQRIFVPIRSAASALGLNDTARGKTVHDSNGHASESESDISSSEASDASVRSRERARRRQRRRERQWDRMNRKHPGAHRPDCRCPRCTTTAAIAPQCPNCGIVRNTRPPIVNPPYMMPWPIGPGMRPAVLPPRNAQRRRRHNQVLTPPGSTPSVGIAAAANDDDTVGGDRIRGEEDMRTWLLTYELSLDVYLCANKFLMDDFKTVVMRHCIDMLESAGSDAAQPTVLRLCFKLYAGVPESDPLLKMILARVGFLQPTLWQRAPQHTSEFLIGHPEVAALMLRETAIRREEDLGSRALPSMELATNNHPPLARETGFPLYDQVRPPPPPLPQPWHLATL